MPITVQQSAPKNVKPQIRTRLLKENVANRQSSKNKKRMHIDPLALKIFRTLIKDQKDVYVKMHSNGKVRKKRLKMPILLFLKKFLKKR